MQRVNGFPSFRLESGCLHYTVMTSLACKITPHSFSLSAGAQMNSLRRFIWELSDVVCVACLLFSASALQPLIACVSMCPK